MSAFKDFRKGSLPAEPFVDNRLCAHSHCQEWGAIAHTTHAGPETKWYCADHAFDRPGQRATVSKRHVMTESELTAHARAYNDSKGITNPRMSREERLAALKAFCRKATIGHEPNTDWAYALLSRINEGEILPRICEQYAKEIVGVTE